MTKYDSELLKIPAFKRKRSLLSSRAAKKSFEMAIADNGEKRDRSAAVRHVSPVAPIRPLVRISDSQFQRIELDPVVEPAGPREYLLVGEVTFLIPKIMVGIVKISTSVKVGEMLLFEGDGNMFEEKIESMEIDRKKMKVAKKGAEIGLKMKQLPLNGTKVWRVVN